MLKCTSTYPASPENTNILTIPHMRELFGCEVGLSDHTMGLGAAIAAVAHGATVVEKHFTLRRAYGGVDSAFSLEPEEMAQLVVETESERRSLVFRRSLYVVKDMEPGEAFTRDNVRAIRPGYGLAPKYLQAILGTKAARDIEKGTPLQ